MLVPFCEGQGQYRPYLETHKHSSPSLLPQRRITQWGTQSQEDGLLFDCSLGVFCKARPEGGVR